MRRPIRLILPILLLLSVTLIPNEAKAQIRAAASDRQAWNESLEIGPVPGLTTDWHAAPIETGIPLGETVELRLEAGTWDPVEWTGAREIERDGVYSVARVHIAHPGSQQVTVKATTRLGHERIETVTFYGVDLGLTPLTLSPIQVSVDEIVIDPANPNASTMRYFFRPQSIALLVTVGADHYRTSVNRWMTFAVNVEPAKLAPLVEWTVNGEVLKPLGARVELMVYGALEHAIAAGGDAAWSPQVRLDTYSVRITEDTRNQRIVDGVPITYRAETDPPGFESEVAWLASTKYGTCSPDRGTGPEFTTVFSNTAGPQGQWLGVRVGNESLSQDLKLPGGGFMFPGRAEDLEEQQLWYRRKQVHGAGIQRLGYDLSMIHFDEEAHEWTTFRDGETGSENRDWIVYGKPVYAIADALVTNCWRNAPENEPGEKGIHPGVHDGRIPGGGNSLFTSLANSDRVLYAHFIPGTIPEFICPTNEVFMDIPNGLNTVLPIDQRRQIKRGQFLGLAGNSGQSTGPHLHIHIQEAGENPGPVSVPFKETCVFGLDNDTVPPAWALRKGQVLPPGMIAIDPSLSSCM